MSLRRRGKAIPLCAEQVLLLEEAGTCQESWAANLDGSTPGHGCKVKLVNKAADDEGYAWLITVKLPYSHLALQQMRHCWGRRKAHREEVVRLQQQLKSTAMTSKGGAVEADRFKKDLEKTRCPPHASCLSSISHRGRLFKVLGRQSCRAVPIACAIRLSG